MHLYGEWRFNFRPMATQMPAPKIGKQHDTKIQTYHLQLCTFLQLCFHCWLVQNSFHTAHSMQSHRSVRRQKVENQIIFSPHFVLAPSPLLYIPYLLRSLLLLLWIARSELHDQTKRNFIATGFSFFIFFAPYFISPRIHGHIVPHCCWYLHSPNASAIPHGY